MSRKHWTGDPAAQDPRPRRWRRRSRAGTVAVVAVAGMLAVACGGGGGGNDNGGGNAAPSSASSAGTPKVGGTLTFAEFSAPIGLDPIVQTGSGYTGLIEATAIYDTLLRYNYDTGKYEAGTADSATANADSTVWTIKIHPGIKFTDGTDYNADAVVFNLNRVRSGLPGAPPCQETISCPRNSTASSFNMTLVKDITAVDPLTVQVTLSEPWASFPVALSDEPGLIASPTALKKCDPAAPVNQCAFNTAPVGAGPFMITSFKSGEAITMARNPNYWGGQVYLDGLKFINPGDAGGQKTLDAFTTGQADMALLRDPVAVAAAHAAGDKGFSATQYGGSFLLMNLGNPQAGTANLTVRQAVAAAIDPNVISQRAYQGKLKASSQLFPPTFKWYPGNTSGPKYDLDKAKQLVAQAKSEGWNGQIRVLASNSGAGQNAGLAIEAMLESAGFQVNLDTSKDTAASIALLAKKDFDIYVNGFQASDDDSAIVGIAQNFLSTAPSNRAGIKDPTLDADFAQLFAAKTDAEKKAAFGKVELELYAQLPMVPVATLEDFFVQTDKVHDAIPNMRSSMRFDKAWLG